MTERIEVVYGELHQMSTHFENQADEIQQMYQHVKNQAESLHGNGWRGKAADDFINEMNNVVLPAVARLQNALEGSGQLLKTISTTFSQADEEAGSLFR